MDKLEEIKRKWRVDFPKTFYSEDIDWLIKEIEGLREDLEMYQEHLDREKNLYYFASEKRKDYETALREIDTHIQSTPEPLPYIIETIKNKLPEYK